MFPDIAYLDWIDGRPAEAEYDLGSSDLRRGPADAGSVVPPALDGTPTPDSTLEAQIAAVYGVDAENVLVTAGATHANALAAATALSIAEDDATTEDDPDAPAATEKHRVLVEKPGYEPLVATPEGLGATVDRFRRPDEEGYPLDPDRVDAATVEDTALVTVTNRHNPSGRRASREELSAVARRVGDEDARLLVDEVYAPFDVEAGDGPFGGPTAAGLPYTVVTSSLTKFLGFGDLRVGWLVGDAEFVARARSIDHHFAQVAEPSRRLARRALADADRLADESRARIRENRNALATFVADREDLSGRVEPGCPYAFLRHESADGGEDDDALSDGDEVARAAWENGVLVVPGRFFDDSERFRICACRDPETVREGLDRLGDVLDSLGG
ncbi:pyridoxal phosphate-dependent aminotransferase [Halorussus sp. MSC15.2]|uniref:pyridoxal phosphate-dependent aminotransferase n=1 Tax=Halorussus sp. MSC15.2 TaxID=2283638 RepID=UPI0013D0F3EA|nr:pyridoxal phosphate-dependent aminotransferase [Halorussus sp. MSC15.2]NEU57119.1 pyridoxal phosphate-dependent aminotransferase [Halorussus sp. MSC15.2]